MVCVQCGRVVEFFDPEIEALQDRIASQHGFRISEHALYMYGECPECLALRGKT
jgi:Fur family ferric uptake transcriptional regulator